MAERWLPWEDRHAIWHPDLEQLRVVGWRPGPAGLSVVSLDAGLDVAVDHASPTTLTEVTVDLVSGGTVAADHVEVLAGLLGEEVADQLRRLPGQVAPDRPVPLSRRRGRAEWEREREDVGSGEAFARFVVAADLAGEAGRSALARALAALEAAEAAGGLRPALTLELATRGLDLLDEGGAVPSLDPGVAARAATLLESLAGRLPGRPLQERARRAADRLRSDGARAAGFARREVSLDHIAAAPAAMAAPAEAAQDRRRAQKSAPAAPEPRPIQVEGEHRAWAGLDAGHHVRIGAGRAAEGRWARVFRRSDRLLLGLAPMRLPSDGDDQTRAIVVIPPTPAADLVVDLTDDPSAPRRSPTHDQLRAAVLAGRAASRRTRLGDPAADADWQRCAGLWEQLGDVQRTNLARRHGSRVDRSPSARAARRFAGPRLLADEVD